VNNWTDWDEFGFGFALTVVFVIFIVVLGFFA
jgi:hypothetical protein